ncbi:hypothetical protein, conserved [Angomonas deanei]|uniref:Uncharacterized protein n=1 Tax=Angomonas deanei TaxID=59799 RepID=A0A7G2C4V4_9TRYP|nr:hypothetical protein, conserved [Angomonas deanei]
MFGGTPQDRDQQHSTIYNADSNGNGYTTGSAGKASYSRKVKPGEDVSKVSQASANAHVQRGSEPVRESGRNAQDLNANDLPQDPFHYAHVVMQERNPYYNQQRQVNEVRPEAFANGEIPLAPPRENPLRYARPYAHDIQQVMMEQQVMMMQQQLAMASAYGSCMGSMNGGMASQGSMYGTGSMYGAGSVYGM